MRRSAVLLVCAALAASPRCARAQLEVTDVARHPFSTDFPAGGKLRLRIRSGDVRILGTADDKISVELSGQNAPDARELKVRFDRKGTAAEMRISGGPRNRLTITIRIPSNTDLHARVPFGELEVRNVTGSQDVEMHAGELTVDVGDAAEYSRVDASVYTGELDAVPFHESHGGLFRSFRTHGSGRFRLHAHIGAGQLTLRSRSTAGAA